MRERVIEIQRLTPTPPDALGRPRTTWTTEAETFAAIGAQSGREFFDAPQITAQQRNRLPAPLPAGDHGARPDRVGRAVVGHSRGH